MTQVGVFQYLLIHYTTSSGVLFFSETQNLLNDIRFTRFTVQRQILVYTLNRHAQDILNDL